MTILTGVSGQDGTYAVDHLVRWRSPALCPMAVHSLLDALGFTRIYSCRSNCRNYRVKSGYSSTHCLADGSLGHVMATCSSSKQARHASARLFLYSTWTVPTGMGDACKDLIVLPLDTVVKLNLLWTSHEIRVPFLHSPCYLIPTPSDPLA